MGDQDGFQAQIDELRREVAVVRKQSEADGADILMHQHIIEILLVQYLSGFEDPIEALDTLSGASLDDLEGLYSRHPNKNPGENFHTLVQTILNHEENLWKGVRQRLQQGT